MLEILTSWICVWRLNGQWFYISWSFIFLVFSLLRHLQLAVRKAGSFSFFFLFLSIVTVAVGRYSRWVVFTRVDWLSCSDLVGDLDLVGLEAFLTAFKKIKLGCWFILRSFRVACSLGMRSFVWIWRISVSLLNARQLLENAWLSAPQWQYMAAVPVHLSLLCPSLLHLAHVAIV